MDTFEECRRLILDEADAAVARIKKRQLRADAFERVMQNHMRTSNYPPEFERKLLNLALTRFDGRER